MSTASGPIERLPYKSELFVGREKQIQEVVDSIGRMCRGEVEEKRVRVFTGETAIGKTWLLKAIIHAIKGSEFSQQCLIYEFKLPNRSEVENDNKATIQVRKIMEEFALEILPKSIRAESIREIALPKLYSGPQCQDQKSTKIRTKAACQSLSNVSARHALWLPDRTGLDRLCQSTQRIRLCWRAT